MIKVLKGCPVLRSSSNYEGGPFTKELLVEHAIKSPIIYQLNLYISEIGYSFLCASTFKYLLKTIKKVQNIFNMKQLIQKIRRRKKVKMEDAQYLSTMCKMGGADMIFVIFFYTGKI